jgi:hypothetical protein
MKVTQHGIVADDSVRVCYFVVKQLEYPLYCCSFANAGCIGSERRMDGAQQEFPDVMMDVGSER